MNRTDGEPETDVMATAFSTMRKCGMNIITATQHMGKRQATAACCDY